VSTLPLRLFSNISRLAPLRSRLIDATVLSAERSRAQICRELVDLLRSDTALSSSPLIMTYRFVADVVHDWLRLDGVTDQNMYGIVETHRQNRIRPISHASRRLLFGEFMSRDLCNHSDIAALLDMKNTNATWCAAHDYRDMCHCCLAVAALVIEGRRCGRVYVSSTHAHDVYHLQNGQRIYINPRDEFRHGRRGRCECRCMVAMFRL
jgi:hypothetical protein